MDHQQNRIQVVEGLHIRDVVGRTDDFTVHPYCGAQDLCLAFRGIVCCV